MAYRDETEAVRAENAALHAEVERLGRELERERRERAGAERPRRRRLVAVALFVVASLGAAAAALAVGAPFEVVAVAVATSLCLGAAALLVATSVRLVPPGEALVVSGRRRRAADGKVVGYRVVTGGMAVLVPIVEHATGLDLRPLRVERTRHDLPSRPDVRVGVGYRATVRVARHEVEMRNAIERFLGRDRSEMASVAADVLDAAVASIVAAVYAEELFREVAEVSRQVGIEAHDGLERLGLELDSLVLEPVGEPTSR